MRLRFCAASDTGLVRSRNEDSFLLVPRGSGVFIAVADGVGGHRAGEVASRIATRTLRHALFEGVPLQGPDESRVKEAILLANEAILRARAAPDSPGQDMGTTLTCAWTSGAHCLIAHVGDSRLYRWRHGTLSQLTDDHTLLGELVRQGTVRPEEARLNPHRHVLMNALGMVPDIRVDIRLEVLRADDILLLCTDGLTGALSEEVIMSVLDEGFTDGAERLVAAANAAGGRDNVTVVMVAVEAKDLEEVAGR